MCMSLISSSPHPLDHLRTRKGGGGSGGRSIGGIGIRTTVSHGLHVGSGGVVLVAVMMHWRPFAGFFCARVGSLAHHITPSACRRCRTVLLRVVATILLSSALRSSSSCPCVSRWLLAGGQYCLAGVGIGMLLARCCGRGPRGRPFPPPFGSSLLSSLLGVDVAMMDTLILDHLAMVDALS